MTPRARIGASHGARPVGIFEWIGTSYKQLATGTTAPLPANFWFAMIVRVEGKFIRVSVIETKGERENRKFCC